MTPPLSIVVASLDMLWICGILFALIGLEPDETETRHLHPPLLGSGSQPGRSNLWRADASDVCMKEIQLANSPFKTLVDDEDYPFLNEYRWRKDPANYVVRSENMCSLNKIATIYMHVVIMGGYSNLGYWDHRDRNPLNNQKSNIRPATGQQNSSNIKCVRHGRKSPYKGIWLFTGNRPTWGAAVRCNGVSHYLGRFITPKQAALAYNSKALELFGEFASVNQL